jgi:electron transfer flavoprotein beta subunit
MKAVVEPESRIELDDAGGVRRTNFRYELNEYDLYAVEEAIRLAEANDAEVTVVSVGPEEAVQSLRKGLAMGATDAVFVPAEDFLGDAASSAEVLAATLRRLQPDLVLAGVESDDLGTSQVGVLVAERLGYTAVTMTIGVAFGDDDGVVTVRRELEAGNFVDIDVRLPALLTIQTGLNEPRYPSLKGIMAAKRKELVRLELSELGVDTDHLVETIELSYPPARQRAHMLEGGPDAVVGELVTLLREKEKVL